MAGALLPRSGQKGAGPRPSQLTLLLAVALGFSTGVFTGFMYHKHQEIHSIIQQQNGAHDDLVHRLRGASDKGSAARTAGAVSLTKGAFNVVRFTADMGGLGQSPPPANTKPAGADEMAENEKKGDLKSKQGFYRRSIWHSDRNATGLTHDQIQAISKALDKAARKHPGDTIHALMTGNGSPYQNIQGRIMYQTLKMAMKMPGGDKITGFTRILHRTKDDDLVVEFPTFRAYPLQPSCDDWCEFPVKDRANAVVQWLMAAAKDPSMIQGAWLLLLESDYTWTKPLIVPGSAHDPNVPGLGFSYDYINPQYPDVSKYIKEMCPACKLEDVPPSGPSPVLLRPRELALVAPDWEYYSAWIENNKKASDVLGWVREMYAWCVGVTKNNVEITHEPSPQSRLMAQPPHDISKGNACFYHYTWGPVYKKDGKDVWHWDKREYTDKKLEYKLPKFQLPPEPWDESWRLQDSLKVKKSVHEQMVEMLTVMNKAVDQLPDLTGRCEKIRSGEEP